jgi:pimeloyl-ACP methyl ester carboxylesterase
MNTPQHPLDLAIVTGFGDKGIEDLKTNLEQNLPLQSSRVIQSAPWTRALDEPEAIIIDVSLELESQPSPNLVLIGHSYGALIALVVACRRRMEGILKLILIDGPLRSDVEVKPAKTLHRPFFKHYRERVRLARECEAAYPELLDDRFLTIGTNNDKIVPPAAKRLLDQSIHIKMDRKEQSAGYPKFMKGYTHVGLDMPETAGHGLTKTKAEVYGNIIKNMI